MRRCKIVVQNYVCTTLLFFNIIVQVSNVKDLYKYLKKKKLLTCHALNQAIPFSLYGPYTINKEGYGILLRFS